MTKHNTNITKEQAITQLRATRAGGHYIDWDTKNNVPDIVGAEGITVDGYLSRKDIESLYVLIQQGAK
jgi:hypothetical protein